MFSPEPALLQMARSYADMADSCPEGTAISDAPFTPEEKAQLLGGLDLLAKIFPVEAMKLAALLNRKINEPEEAAADKDFSLHEKAQIVEGLRIMAFKFPVESIRMAIVLERKMPSYELMEQVVVPKAGHLPTDDFGLLRKAAAYVVGIAAIKFADMPPQTAIDIATIQSMAMILKQLHRVTEFQTQVHDLADYFVEKYRPGNDVDLIASIVPFTSRMAVKPALAPPRLRRPSLA